MKPQDKFIVIDDCISPTYQAMIKEMVENPDCGWQFQPNMDYGSYQNKMSKNNYQFIFGIYGENKVYHTKIYHALYGLMAQMIDGLIPGYQPSRIRCLLQPPAANMDKHYYPHTDGGHEDGISLIYYPCDADGDTYLFKEMSHDLGEEKFFKNTSDDVLFKAEDWTNKVQQWDWKPIDSVTPKQGRLIMFPAHQYHAGSSPTKTKRMLINFNFNPTDWNYSMTSEDVE